MTEPKQNDPFEFMRQDAQAEQMRAGMATVARAASHFYAELISVNIPESLAAAMVMAWFAKILGQQSPQ